MASAGYAVLKQVHVTCVVLSGTGFALRGYWMCIASPHLQRRVVRVLPHVIDTVLLASAISLAVLAGLDPRSQSWLAAKIAGLLAYIALGAVALRRGRTRTVRATAFALALAVYAYIVSVALTRDARGWLALL